MFSKEELIYDLLCAYHSVWLSSIDRKIEGMTKVMEYEFDERNKIRFEISADDYDRVKEMIEIIERG